MFGRWVRGAAQASVPDGSQRLLDVVRKELPQADEESVLVVSAIAGLLGAVAYADREYSSAEEKRVREELARVHGMTEGGITAICSALRAHVVEASTVQLPRYSRLLLELGDRELRLEVLETLLEVAAADGSIDTAEVNMLRLTANALGLTQDDYNAAQAKHRDRLRALSR